jgi:hypothetical protein
MQHRLEPGSFGEIENALLEQVRHEASCQAIAEPFMRGLPPMTVGVRHAHVMLQRRLILLAEARLLFHDFTPHEMEIRELCGIPHGSRKLSR